MPPEDRAAMDAAWLARPENGRWPLWAYQSVAADAGANAGARRLRDAMAAGTLSR